MIVLDTHTLLWWVNDPTTLSKPAKKAIDETVTSKSVHVSCISSWEIALLVARGRLRLALDVRDWLCRCEAPVICGTLILREQFTSRNGDRTNFFKPN